MSIVKSNDVIELIQRDEYESKQTYEDETVRSVVCKKCRGDVFHVAQGSYLTVIKCITCEWEAEIHEG